MSNSQNETPQHHVTMLTNSFGEQTGNTAAVGRDPPGEQPLRNAAAKPQKLSGTKRKRQEHETSSWTRTTPRRRLDPPAVHTNSTQQQRRRETHHFTATPSAAVHDVSSSSHRRRRRSQTTATPVTTASIAMTTGQPTELQSVTPEAHQQSSLCVGPSKTTQYHTESTATPLHTTEDIHLDDASSPSSIRLSSTSSFVLEQLPDDWSQTSRQHLEHDLQCIQTEDRYTVTNVLGVGAFGCVVLATDNDDGVQMALKWMDTTLAATATLMATEERCLRESIGVPGVVQYRGSKTTTTCDLDLIGSFLVMDYIPGQDLTRVINDGGPLTERRCRTILGQLLRSLHMMHEDRHIVHRDIKPGNVMVHQQDDDDKVVVTIVDLGICCAVPPGMTLRGKAGSEGYSAPEIWDESNPYYAQGYDRKADMYSVGCLVYTMLRGRVYQPLLLLSDNDSSWQGMSFVARDFVRNLTQPNPKLRMTAEEAHRHPFVAGNGIVPTVRMARRWTEHFCSENATYIGIGAAFLVAAKFS